MPQSVLAVKWATALMAACFCCLVFRWLSFWVGRAVAAGAALVILFHPLIVLFGTQVLSDIPFLLLTVLILIQVERCMDAELGDKQFIVLVALLMGSVLLREVGWALVFTVTLILIRRKRLLESAVVFLGPMVANALWYYRNEILVARLERPSLQKLSVIFSHFHTMPGEPLVAELWARAVSNASAYAAPVSGLLFVPETANGLSPVGGLYAAFSGALPSVQWMLIAVPAVLFLAGIFFGVRMFVVQFQLLFAVLYAAVLLLYPYVDVRLAMVLVVPWVSVSAIGFQSLHGRLSPAGKRIIIAALAVCLLPNVGWVTSYAWTKQQVKNTPPQVQAVVVPSMPYRAVGEWINGHLPARSVLASWRKEMALWAGDRPMVHLQMLMVQDEFEALLRDEGIEYIICIVDEAGLRDVEAELALCETRSFRTLVRMGDLEVVQVLSRDAEHSNAELLDSRVLEARKAFGRALRLLHELHPEEAANGFRMLLERSPHNALLTFYYALAQGMSGKFEEAQTLLRRLKQFSQTSAMIGQLHYHEQLLERVQRLARNSETRGRAQESLSLAFDYWSAGFRNVALYFVRQAIAADSTFTPAYEAAGYLFVVQGDTTRARWALGQLIQRNPQSYFVAPLRQLLTSAEALRKETDTSVRGKLRLAITRSYLQFALVEQAINELHQGLAEDKANAGLLELLANIYLFERRSSPALRFFEQLAAIDSHPDIVGSAQQKLDALRARR